MKEKMPHVAEELNDHATSDMFIKLCKKNNFHSCSRPHVDETCGNKGRDLP